MDFIDIYSSSELLNYDKSYQGNPPKKLVSSQFDQV